MYAESFARCELAPLPGNQDSQSLLHLVLRSYTSCISGMSTHIHAGTSSSSTLSELSGTILRLPLCLAKHCFSLCPFFPITCGFKLLFTAKLYTFTKFRIVISFSIFSAFSYCLLHIFPHSVNFLPFSSVHQKP